MELTRFYYPRAPLQQSLTSPVSVNKNSECFKNNVYSYMYKFNYHTIVKFNFLTFLKFVTQMSSLLKEE